MMRRRGESRIKIREKKKSNMYKNALYLFFLFPYRFSWNCLLSKTGGVYRLLCTCGRRVPAEYQPTHRKGWEREGICDKLTDRKERGICI